MNLTKHQQDELDQYPDHTDVKGNSYRIVKEDDLVTLLKDAAKLRALECGGVKSWEWYSDSLQDNGYYQNYEPGD